MILTLRGGLSSNTIFRCISTYFSAQSWFLFIIFFEWMVAKFQNILIPLILKLSKSLRICRFHISIITWKVQFKVPTANCLKLYQTDGKSFPSLLGIKQQFIILWLLSFLFTWACCLYVKWKWRQMCLRSQKLCPKIPGCHQSTRTQW